MIRMCSDNKFSREKNKEILWMKLIYCLIFFLEVCLFCHKLFPTFLWTSLTLSEEFYGIELSNKKIDRSRIFRGPWLKDRKQKWKSYKILSLSRKNFFPSQTRLEFQENELKLAFFSDLCCCSIKFSSKKSLNQTTN